MTIRAAGRFLGGVLLWTLALASPVAAQWPPPIGIPSPAFGITQQAKATPNPWTSPVAGFYYVNQAGGTDTNNPFGTPALPRATIPNTLPAGAVVEVRGTYARRHTSPNNLVLNGTLAQPVFIRGLSVAQRTLATSPWEIRGTNFVVENFEFAISIAEVGVSILSPSSSGSFRYNVVRGNASGGGMSLNSFSSAVSTNIVVYNNIIRDNGDVNATFDQDVHGIELGRNQSFVWIVDNEIARNSGDGVQANSENTSHHLYFGRNLAYGNKQTGLWSKRNRDVIFSQNLVHSHRPSDSSPGAGLGFQYGPERIWFLYNHIHSCDFGIVGASGQDSADGLNVYVIGNVIHDIHQASGVYQPGSGFANAAVMLNGGFNRFVINNTFHDVDAGFNSPASNGNVSLVNNVISGLAANKGAHVFLEQQSLANASNMSNSLFTGTVRIKWGSNTVHTVPTFQAAFPGKCLVCLSAPSSPYPGGEEYAMPAGSPAVDSAVTHSVYATFQSLYGVSIARDVVGAPRPGLTAYDMGAYERQCLTP